MSDPPQDDLSWLCERLGLDEDEALELLLWCHDADHRLTVVEHGYAKDNRFWGALSARFELPLYQEALREAGMDALDVASDDETRAMCARLLARLDRGGA